MHVGILPSLMVLVQMKMNKFFKCNFIVCFMTTQINITLNYINCAQHLIYMKMRDSNIIMIEESVPL
jgi:hypothetical protein